MAAFRFLAEKRRNYESHRALGIAALGANPGDGKELTKILERYEEESE